MRTCRCGRTISAIRIAVLPDTLVCASCSTERPALTFMVYSGKNTSDLCVIRADAAEAVRLATRAFRRSR